MSNLNLPHHNTDRTGPTEKYVEKYGTALYTAWREGRTIAPLTTGNPKLTIADAYQISLDFLARRQGDGEQIIGKKIGVTSKAVQDMLGVHQPDFGFLTDWMMVSNSGKNAGENARDGRAETLVDIQAKRLIQPRAEAEVAFILRAPLVGPGVSAEQVIAATQAIAPCFEIVDSRIDDWQIGIVDTIADNASCGVFALGAARANARDFDLPNLRVMVHKNGEPLSEGVGKAVQGNPAQAVAWLANKLGDYGVSLDAGDIILSGSMVPLEVARVGDLFEMKLHGIGGCAIRFV